MQASLLNDMKGVIYAFSSAAIFATIIAPLSSGLATRAYPSAAVAAVAAGSAEFPAMLVVAAIMAAKPGLALAVVAVFPDCAYAA